MMRNVWVLLIPALVLFCCGSGLVDRQRGVRCAVVVGSRQ
jgi:hypothetical protein